MRYYLSILVAIGVACSNCAHRSQSARDLLPETAGLVTTFGEFSATGSAWTVRTSEGAVSMSRPRPFGAVSVSPSRWRTVPGWFVFIESDERVWAFDGVDYLFLLTVDERGTASYGPRGFPCRVPRAVYSRLSASAQKGIKNHE